MGVDCLSISGFDENDGYIEQALDMHQQWEPHVQGALEKILSSDDVFLDIGANVGIHSVFASKLAKEVIAIEPSKENFKHLLKTIELNKCDNITCHNIGLWDQDETRVFCHLPSHPGQSHFTTVNHHESDAIKTDIEVKKLDNLKLPHIDVVKMDVEGVEKFVLRGGMKIFDECPILFIELNCNACRTNTGENIKRTLYQIMSFGYEVIYYARTFKGGCVWTEIDFNSLIKTLSPTHVIDAIFMPYGKKLPLPLRFV